MIEKEHIFLVEDELHLRQTLTLIMRDEGYRVTSAEDGSSALAQLLNLKKKSETVDLLVTDIQMPDMSGIKLIDVLEKENIKLPILVISGHRDEGLIVELRHRGCSEFLDKPFEPSEFLDRVGIMLEKNK
jgi:DNA-binding response OmpR family regulator